MALGVLALIPATVHARPPAPDLQVVSIANAARPATAGKLDVRVTVRNAGNRKARAFTVAVYLSSDAKQGRGDALLGRRSVNGLKAAARNTGARADTVPRVAPGLYHVLACVDDRKQVRELNERNNCRASRTRVTVTAGTPAPAPAPVLVEPLPSPILLPPHRPPRRRPRHQRPTRPRRTPRSRPVRPAPCR